MKLLDWRAKNGLFRNGAQELEQCGITSFAYFAISSARVLGTTITPLFPCRVAAFELSRAFLTHGGSREEFLVA
jgi:hypothetical protein